ncbi:MAG: phage tail tape measure C-terminal domain-containing protein, partial [Casimicrobium sp.]
NTQLRGEIELQLIDLARQQVQAELDRDGPSGTKRYSAAEVERLKVLNDQIALQRSTLAIRTTEQELAQQALDVSTAENRNKADLLEGQRALAETSKERLDIELKLLDLQFDEQKARLDAILASQASTEAEKQIAAARLALLPQLRAQAEASTRRDAEGPLAQFKRDAKVTSDDLERIQVDGIQKVSDGLADVITKSKSLKSVFKDVANSIISDLIRITIQQAIVGAIAGGTPSGGGGLLGSLFGGFRAAGGPVRAGVPYIVGEKRPEVFVPNQSGNIVPSLAQFNTNIPKINATGGQGQRSVVEIRVRAGEMFEPMVRTVSGNVAVQVVRDATPQIMEGGAMMALKSANRLRQNG